ncbi:hypothetical protein U1Q18_027773 [Sarracenia purpurea var. burkii]
MVVLQSDPGSAVQIVARTVCYFSQVHPDSRPEGPASVRTPARPRAFNAGARIAAADKPSICTADELHFVSVPNSDWRLALWRYTPPPQVLFLSLD